MRHLAAFVCALLLIAVAGNTQEKKAPAPDTKQAPEWKIPPEAAARTNPVKPTESSIADGRKLYGYQCTMCHGDHGDGKGDLAETKKMGLKDWRDPASLKDFTDGALFYVLEKGKGDMPGQEGRMKAEQEWNLVNFIRSLAKKEPAAKAKE